MNRPVALLRDAEQDVAEIARWYDEQREGLGAEFLDAIERTASRIRRWPACGPLVGPRTRRALVAGFPYLLMYVSLKERIEVTAVCHFARHPRRWGDRVQERTPEYAAA